jgi:hypothetical protein
MILKHQKNILTKIKESKIEYSFLIFTRIDNIFLTNIKNININYEKINFLCYCFEKIDNDILIDDTLNIVSNNYLNDYISAVDNCLSKGCIGHHYLYSDLIKSNINNINNINMITEEIQRIFYNRPYIKFGRELLINQEKPFIINKEIYFQHITYNFNNTELTRLDDNIILFKKK